MKLDMAELAAPRVIRDGTAPGEGTARRLPMGVMAVLPVAAGVLLAAHLLAMREGPGWQSPLLVGDHLFDLALALGVLLYGLALGRRLGGALLGLSDDALIEGLAAMLLGIGIMSLGMLVAGFLGLYYTAALLVAVAALTLWLRRELVHTLGQVWHRGLDWLRAGAPTAPTLAQRLLVPLIALDGAIVLLEAMLPPGWGSPVEWDTPGYHLAAPKLYVAAHRFLPLPDMPLADAPSGMEMLYTAGLLLHSDGMAKLLSALSLLLFGLATVAIGRRHFGPQAGWLALFLLATVSWIGVEAPSAFPDFASFALLLLAVSDGVAWMSPPCRSREPGAGPESRGRDRLLIRMGLLAGLACSFKLVNLPGIPALALTVGLWSLAHGAGTPAARLWRAVRAGGVICLAALAPLAPWLLKNIYFFHTMVYGLAVQVNAPAAGSVAVSAAAQQSPWGHLLWIARNMLDIAWTSIGPLSPLLAVAPLLAWHRKWRQTGSMFTFLLIAGVLWLLVVPRFVAPRYYAGLIAVGEILLGAVLAASMAALPLRLRRLANMTLSVYLALAVLLSLGLGAQQATQNRAISYAIGAISRDEYLGARVRPYAAERWADAHLPVDAPVVLLAVTRGYYLDQPHLAESYHLRRDRLDAGGSTRADEIARWCRAGVRYAILDQGYDELDSMDGIRPLASFAWSHLAGLHLRLLFSAHGVDVLSVTPCR